MSFPQSKEFEDALGAVEVTSEIPKGPHDILFDPDSLSPRQRESGPTSSLRPLYLKYAEGTIGCDALLRKVKEELTRVGCVSDTRIAIAVLGLISETRPPTVGSVEHANNFFVRTVEAKLHYILVLPTHSQNPRAEKYKLGGFSYEIFNPKKMLYWSDKTHPGKRQTRYPIDLESLKRHYSFRRDPPLGVKIFDQSEVNPGTPLSRRPPSEAEIGIYGNYLYWVFDYYANEIAEKVIEGACLIEAAGTQYFDPSIFRSFFTSNLGLFCWEAHYGLRTWAVMSYVGGLKINSPGVDPYLNFDRWLEDTLGFRGYSGKTSFQESVRSYSRFLQRAQRHKWNGRYDDAYLHFVIALDMLFGLDGNSAQKVKQRVAILVHRQRRLTLEEQTTRVDKIYIARSKYVHAGQAIQGNESLQEVEEVCVQVLWCLLAVENQGAFNEIQTYTAAIDHIETGLRAGKTIEEQSYAELGISPYGELRDHDRITVDDNIRYR
jgi:hypothetical protein